ncbi:MAG: hypothetical protein M1837_000576 [Sclerophora amabilis]|nr:MAG: hypothetical protein M1837_000576 [Sclerophora amabilis]
MLRTSLRSLRPTVSQPIRPAALSFTRGMAEGATGSGSSRAGGIAQGFADRNGYPRDAFTKREKGAEDKFVKDKEREKLQALKDKIKQQRSHLDELDKHIDEISSTSGGEKN